MNDVIPNERAFDRAASHIMVIPGGHAERRQLESALAPLQRELAIATSHQAALHQLAERPAALIVIDVGDTDGFEAVIELRGTPANLDTAILLVTARAPDREGYRGYQLEAVDYVALPLAADVLRARARVFLQLHDRTWQLRAEVAAAAANQKRFDDAQVAVQLTERFAGVLGHDLRNPLAAIVAAAQLLVARRAVPDSDPTVRRILTSADRMARMVDQLLDLTRIRSSSGIPSEPHPMSLGSVATEVVDELRAARPERTLALRTVGDLRGSWDPDRLAQLLSNLISNAMEHGRPEVAVEVEVDGRAAEAVHVRVRNGGVVPDEVLPVIFEPFKGSHVRRRGSMGLGLGLYISREIARAHNGSIELTSAEPDGTCFIVTLPRDLPGPTRHDG